MLAFLLIKDRTTLAAVFFNEELVFDDFCYGVEAKSGEDSLGYCLYRISEGKAEISVLFAKDGDNEIREGLIRSALHSAALWGALMAECRLMEPERLLLDIGFYRVGDRLCAHIPDVLGKCRH